MKARPFLQGAGLAILYVAPFAEGFLTATLGDAYHRVHPLTSIYRAILIAILALWALGALFFLLLDRLPQSSGRMLWIIPLILLPWLFFRGASAALAAWPQLALQALDVGRILTWIAAGGSLLLLLVRPAMLDRCIAACRVAYAVLGFGIFVLGPRIAYYALSSEPREITSFERANIPSVSPSAPRIVWILMDELSYDQVFPSRQPDVLLPNFDAFAKSSVVFSDVQPVGTATEAVLPSLLLGRRIVELRKPYAGPPSYRSTSSGSWQRFSQYDTVFADAKSAGWTTGIAGWYNPYCRLLPDVLDRCSWQYLVPGDGGLASTLDSSNSVSANLLIMLPFRDRMNRVMHWPVHKRSDLIRADYTDAMARAEDIIQDSRIRFAFIHLPVPHPPGIYDREHHSIRDYGTYLDNLVLADESLGTLRKVLESTPAAAHTTLIVSSDHSWRTFMWKHSADWSVEATRATRDSYDPRPVLLVSLPGSRAHEVIAEPVDALFTHSIVENLLRDEIHTNHDIDQLIERSFPQKGITGDQKIGY